MSFTTRIALSDRSQKVTLTLGKVDRTRAGILSFAGICS